MATVTTPAASGEPAGQLHRLLLDCGIGTRGRYGEGRTLTNVAKLAGLNKDNLRRALGLVDGRYAMLTADELRDLVQACHQVGAVDTTYRAVAKAHFTDLGHPDAFDIKFGVSTADALVGALQDKPPGERIEFIIDFLTLTLEGRETRHRIEDALRIIRAVFKPAEQVAVVQALIETIAQARQATWGGGAANDGTTTKCPSEVNTD